MRFHADLLGSIPDGGVFILNRLMRHVGFHDFHDVNTEINKKDKNELIKKEFKTTLKHFYLISYMSR